MKKVGIAHEVPFSSATKQWIENSLLKLDQVYTRKKTSAVGHSVSEDHRVKSVKLRVSPFPIRSFSRDLLLFLLEFVSYKDKVAFISACGEWYQLYMTSFVRKLLCRSSYKLDIEKFRTLIHDPFHQLSLSSSFLGNEFYATMNYAFNKISYDHRTFLRIMESTRRLKVKDLSLLNITSSSVQAVANDLTRVTDCQSLSLHYLYVGEDTSTIIPYIPSLKSLSIERSADIQSSLLDYCGTLHHLYLYHCRITNVSMLGSIPSLELFDCDDLEDISPLNNNERVVINWCKKIHDFSKSFANSRKITISSVANINTFDMTRWTKVEELILARNAFELSPVRLLNSNQLPKTVKKCDLSGDFVSAINFTITSDHILKELKLSDDNSITSFEGYGLEKVAIIECVQIASLQSLQGLGKGKNRKITICRCGEITDFSPLSHIPIVEISYCYGFTDPSQVQFVRDFTIASCHAIKFCSNPPSNDLFVNVRYLSMPHMNMSQTFDELERIMEVSLGFYGYRLVRNFLVNGGRIKNQKIVLNECTSYAPERLYYLHNRFMKDDYDYYDKLPKQWIWIRKSESKLN